MTKIALAGETKLKILQCGTCGVWHAIPDAMFEACLAEGGFWHCPNGHSRGYKKGTIRDDLEQAQAALAKEKQRREWAEKNAETLKGQVDTLDRELKAQKGQATRAANRAKAGVCACCNRTFKQLAAHMKNKHPDYQEPK